MKKTYWMTGVGAGLAVLCVAVVYASKNRTVDSYGQMRTEVAKSLGVSEADYTRTTTLVDTIRANKGKVSEGDWTFLAAQAKDGQINLRQSALAALAQISKDSDHREEAISLAKGYLAEGHSEGNVPPILVLKRFEDGSWKDHAKRLAESDNPNVSSIGKNLLAKAEKK